MKKRIKIFKSFEEQEMHFLEYFFLQTPSERLKALANLQKTNNKDFQPFAKKDNHSKTFSPMDIEHPEFLNFLRCAQKNKLRYPCIGGYAVNFYGYHRMTEDMDIWIAPTIPAVN